MDPVKIEGSASIAVELASAIRDGQTETLRAMLSVRPELAKAYLVDRHLGIERTLLHHATDWPGHWPRVAETIAVLVEAGADVNAPAIGPHAEVPLHWAASSDDVAAVDALLDAGADIDPLGAVIEEGTPLTDAVAFKKYAAARRLVERGAKVELWHAAALGMTQRVATDIANVPENVVQSVLWHAARAGHRDVMALAIQHGADIDTPGPNGETPRQEQVEADD